ncbi:hypothetical protein ISF_07931 [Cordyceps fumosorosea ARSEF 2679]|uniref:AHC1-like C2H2 zinc-finger domain-containing protein n=1 Tax=Cordyceps fumosorosea (strain ARSEF 2679) TaxID=1081104 RepID=A0A162MFE2_CORFA|nr:hypothetical protein ISF_07931 [Cordyceps fumosorosea ARSEF 2679]OAA55420.1 hypothetical protein ISF_07931 [Cordyceps fumosorosea ARSEF 2679]
MFRFWGSDSRGCDQSIDTSHGAYRHAHQHPTPSPTTASSPSSPTTHPLKRKLHGFDDAETLSLDSTEPHSKRLKRADEDNMLYARQDPLECARDEIRHQFGLEILLKHDELRLINQELAKCQIALEQLRRCHLIPYPVNCPTPDQMLQVTNGKGPALANHPAEPAPKWAPPFGVVDGPYARHYARWLIPDPSFDGMQPEFQFTPEFAAARASFAEGRTTRNSFTETTVGKGRPNRALSGHRLQSLSSGYPQPKDKAGPCILKRSDGQTVKLVCLDCNRENFSSTQGFINHCRIAHKRDFKSHEEAAVQSGQPIDAAPEPRPNSISTPVEDKPAPVTSTSAFVHPFVARDLSDQEAYAALRARIADALKLYPQAKATAGRVVKQPKKKMSKFKASADAPYLSKFMQGKKFNGNLGEIVSDAKTKMSLDEASGDESDTDSSLPRLDPAAVRTPVVMRMPAHSSPTPMARPPSSKGRPAHMDFVSPPHSSSASHGGMSDDDMPMRDDNFSPSTLVSNNAPSLVSDDGEYDDSDEGSSVSEGSDHMDADSASDVAEIALDEEHEPRALRRGSGTVRLRKDDTKHVTFMGPVKQNNTKQRKARRV